MLLNESRPKSNPVKHATINLNQFNREPNESKGLNLFIEVREKNAFEARFPLREHPGEIQRILDDRPCPVIARSLINLTL